MNNWTNQDGINAVRQIIDASFSECQLKRNLFKELEALSSEQRPPVKYFLAVCQQHGDLDISEDIGKLIKDVYFQFG